MNEAQQVGNVKVGQVFYASWGYDQTNIDFAKVLGFTKSGKSAICVMMSQRITDSEGLAPMSEMIVPDEEHGERFKLRIRQSDDILGTVLRGSYPFCSGSKRLGYLHPWKNKPIYQSHYH